MSIFVRPVREQLEHDRLIRQLQAKYKRKNEVAINPGDEQQAPIKIGPSTFFPDLVLSEGKKLVGIVEVETGESVNNLEAMYQWVPFSKAKVPFHLYVPVSGYDAARRLTESNQTRITEIWTYRPANDGFDLVRLHTDPNAVAATKGGKPAVIVALPPKPVPPPPVVEPPKPAPVAPVKGVPAPGAKGVVAKGGKVPVAAPALANGKGAKAPVVPPVPVKAAPVTAAKPIKAPVSVKPAAKPAPKVPVKSAPKAPARPAAKLAKPVKAAKPAKPAKPAAKAAKKPAATAKKKAAPPKKKGPGAKKGR